MTHVAILFGYSLISKKKIRLSNDDDGTSHQNLRATVKIQRGHRFDSTGFYAKNGERNILREVVEVFEAVQLERYWRGLGNSEDE